MKCKNLILLSLFTLSQGFAQPLENAQPLNVQTMTEEERRLFGAEPTPPKEVLEVPVSVEHVEKPGTVEILEVPSLPSKVGAQVSSPMISEPVAEMPIQKPAPKEESKGGLTADYSIAVFPIGYDSINITGDGAEAGRYFFQLAPAIDLHTVLSSSKGKETDVSMSYALIWREYYNKATTSRDFEHDASLNLTHSWSEVVSTTLGTDFVYFFKAGEDTNADNAILWFGNPSVKFKVQDNLSFKLGYTVKYLQLTDLNLSLGDIVPADLEDLRSGIGGGGYDNSSFLPNNAPTALDSTQDVWWTENFLVLGTNFSPTPGTDLGLNINYNFIMFSNSEDMRWKGFYITPSFGQKMPWSGGKLSMKDELRMRNYDSALVDGTDVKKQNFRNRFTIQLDQEISENISWTGFYRHETEFGNADDFKSKNYNHWFYTGLTFSF